MARTIQSPGVEIRERDLSQRAILPTGTNIFMTGFAQKGPTDETIQITSTQELENVFGIPTNPAERYFYFGAKQILEGSNGNLYVNRMPYGDGVGSGFGSSYGALVYPAKVVTNTSTVKYRNNDVIDADVFTALSSTQISILTSGGAFSLGDVSTLQTDGINSYIKYSVSQFSALTAAFDNSALLITELATINSTFYGANDTIVSALLSSASATYVLGAPKFFELTKDEYNSILDGTAYTNTGGTWSQTAGEYADITSIADFGKAGMVVLNKGQSNINSRGEGFYIGIADNTNVEPNTDHNTISHVYTNALTANSTTGIVPASMTEIPEARLFFPLSATTESGANRNNTSISQALEGIAYAFPDSSTNKFDDTLCVGVYKLRTSPYAPDTVKLDFINDENFLGSVDSHRDINNVTGGPAKTFYLSNLTQDSRNVTVLVNDYISNRTSTSWTSDAGVPSKKIRLLTHSASSQLVGNSTLYARFGMHLNDISTIAGNLNYVDALFPLGGYTNTTIKGKSVGSITGKLDRALRRIENDELFDLDLVIEAGLGTIYATCCANQTTFFDDTVTSTALTEGLNALITNEIGTVDAEYKNVRDNYAAIANIFDNFTSQLRKDCLFIADGLRQVYVRGAGGLVLSDPAKAFSQYIYNPLRHIFATMNSSYSCAYANWAKINDPFSGLNVWVPFSPYAAADMANVDSNWEPWYAPAGFTRGKVTNVLALAINPKQKERDMLAKVNQNAVAFFPNDGFNIFGQKTLLRQPSAFDRINVRRLFLYLEKATKKTCKYFVFEPNTTFTRNRVVATLTPIFERAKNTQGVYDFLILCDNRNNTPSTIDASELQIDIYLKPVRAAEFILVNFYATSTGTNFQELIGGK